MIECWTNTSAPENTGIYYTFNDGQRKKVHMTGIGTLFSHVKNKKFIGYGYFDDPDFNEPHDFVHCWVKTGIDICRSTNLKSVFYNINGNEVQVDFTSHDIDNQLIFNKEYVGFGYFLRP